MSLFSGTREWIYSRNIVGTYQRVHRWSGRLLVAGMFILPWLSFRGHPLVMADLPARRLYLAGQIFTAANGYLMVLGALLAAFLLFFVSALFGRVWCGYLCPQTVFLEEWVRRVESLFEGDGTVRARRDRGPWTFDKAWRKAAKVTTLTVLAGLLGMTVMSYFAGAHSLWTGAASSGNYTMVAVIGGIALADWLWFREQACIYLCPYARFQSALTDNHSMTVGFNPNVEIKAGKASGQAGNCIDCKKCVHVCPMGIDIRDGNMQMECIDCARCIDACETVMPKLGHPSLVRYTTVMHDQGKPVQLVRGRTVVYGALITGFALALMVGVGFHNPVEITLHRSPGALYQVDDDGYVRNTYLLRVVNNDAVGAHAFAIGVEGLESVQVTVPPLVLESGEDRTVPLVVRVPSSAVKNTMPIRITVHSDGRTRSIESTFKGPNGS